VTSILAPMLVALCLTPPPALSPAATDSGLAVFRAWLDREHPGYECDAGPAIFRNRTVEAAYPGERFYFVLTHARGIPSPYRKPLSLVARVGEGSDVRPLGYASVENYREGLPRITTPDQARRAAAAVLILLLGDPGEGRNRIDPSLVSVERSRKGWTCDYAHDGNHVSRVVFDRDGLLASFDVRTPPVP